MSIKDELSSVLKTRQELDDEKTEAEKTAITQCANYILARFVEQAKLKAKNADYAVRNNKKIITVQYSLGDNELWISSHSNGWFDTSYSRDRNNTTYGKLFSYSVVKESKRSRKVKCDSTDFGGKVVTLLQKYADQENITLNVCYKQRDETPKFNCYLPETYSFPTFLGNVKPDQGCMDLVFDVSVDLD